MLYKAYHKQIVGNVIAYIAKLYSDYKAYNIYQMPMYKMLAYFDFQCVKQLGSPCLELDFKARRMGPVPEELYNDSDFEDSFTEFKVKKFVTQDGQSRKQYICTCTPDLDYLSDDEIRILNESFNLMKDFNADEVSDFSHSEIKAWKKAYDRTPNSSMLYAEEFERNIFSENESDLTIQEYTFKQYNEFANA